MDELKPCPFCGAKAIMQKFATARGDYVYRATCYECWCATDFDSFTPEEAAEKWNRRAWNE